MNTFDAGQAGAEKSGDHRRGYPPGRFPSLLSATVDAARIAHRDDSVAVEAGYYRAGSFHATGRAGPGDSTGSGDGLWTPAFAEMTVHALVRHSRESGNDAIDADVIAATTVIPAKAGIH